MVNNISKLIETKNLIIKDAAIDQGEELQQICSTWDDKELVEGQVFETDYIHKCLTEADLPPIEGASNENYCLKAICLKENRKVVGFIDMYHGYPQSDTLWIGMFLVHKDYQNKGFGQEIIQAISKDASERDYCKMGLGVYLKNWKALRFWTKAGFDKVIGIYGDKNYNQNAFALVGLERSLA